MSNNPSSNRDNANQYLLLQSGSAPKLGQRGIGQVHFQLLASLDRQNLYIRLSGNDGAGCASDELVDFQRIQSAIPRQEADKPFPARIFRETFIGRSVNNFSFLACVLREVGLLAASEKLHKHVLAGDWTKFFQDYLSKEGEPIEIGGKQAAPLPLDSAEPVAKVQRKDRRKKIASEESSDACPA